METANTNIAEKEKPVKGIRRLAEFYQCSVQKIQDLINDGTIPSYKLGKNRYFYTSEVDKALRDRSLENESTSED